MLILGVAGGVASGKSTVAKELESLGAFRIDADKLGHDALRHPEVIDAIVQRWGKSVLDNTSQTVDRAKIASIVFESTNAQTELQFLESITHPKIQEDVNRLIQECRQRQEVAVVLDAALLFKAKWNHLCDSIVFVDVPREMRLQRALQRGWTESNFLRREKAQVAVEEKRHLSDFFVDNSGTLQSIQHNVREIWKTLGLPPKATQP